MAIMEWVVFVQVIAYMGSHFSFYFGFNIWICISFMLVVAGCGFILLPVIQEEMVKICSIVGPERIVFATGMFQTGSQITTAILGTVMGKFYGNNDRELKLCGGIIMSFVFLISLICIAYFEHYLRKSPYFEQIEALRREDLVDSSLNKKVHFTLKEVYSGRTFPQLHSGRSTPKFSSGIVSSQN